MRQVLRWFPLWATISWLVVATVIFLSLTPHPIKFDIEQGDKLGHALGYMTVMVCFTQLYTRRVHVWWGLGFIALGIALEYVQGWTGYRHFEYWDMVADAVGVAVGWLLGGTTMAHLVSGIERRITL